MEELVTDQPFCAGVCSFGPRGMLFTLGKRKRWHVDATGAWIIPVCWVGGGQEPHESIVECAQREAEEELGCSICLRSSPLTYWYDLTKNRSHRMVACADAVAPLLVEMHPGLATPYKPGLPAGPITYVAIYMAECTSPPLVGDVPGIIEIAPEQSLAFRTGVSLQVAAQSLRLSTRQVPLPLNAILRYERGGPEDQLASLLERGLVRNGHD